MLTIAIVLFLALSGIAALHFYWAFGGLWPGKTPQELANTVIGSKNYARVPGASITLVVSGLIFGAGLLPLAYLSSILPDLWTRVFLWLLVVVFIGRGLVTYLWRPVFSDATEPFRTLNYRYYSPLCLLLGSGILAIVVYV